MSWKSRSSGSASSGTQWLSSTEQPFNRVHQFLNPEGLPDELNTGLIEESLCLCVHHISRYEQKTVFQFRIEGLHQFVKTLAADTRHPLIADNGVIALLFDLVERFHAGIREIDTRSLLRENIENQFRDVNFVVNDQNLLSAQGDSMRRTNLRYRLRLDLPPGGQFERKSRTASIGTPGVQLPAVIF